MALDLRYYQSDVFIPFELHKASHSYSYLGKSIPASEAPCVIISPSSLPCSPLIGPLILQASAHPSAC